MANQIPQLTELESKGADTNSIVALSERASPQNYGLRARAFIVALPLLIALCFLSVYADMVAQNIQFGVLQFAPPALVVLFALALLNRGLQKWFQREWLSRADMVVIYAMLLVGVMLSTRGCIEKLIPPLAFLPYFSTRENRWNEIISQHLPSWAIPFTPSAAIQPPSEALRGYYEGGAKSFLDVPWNIWVGPLFAWFLLICCVLMVFFALATILRRQWMDNEQLRYPLTTLPLAIIHDEVEGQKFFTNRVMWLGVAVSVLVFGINGLKANYPDWPKMVTEMSLSPYFSERPWNTMDYTPIYISLAAIGFAYFLPKDLLFSLWFFFLLTRLQDVMATQWGGMPTGIGTHNARIWTGYQAIGAYLVLVLAQVKIGWPYFKTVALTAFGREKRLDDSGELMPYRTAIIALLLGFGGIVLWLSLAGMHPLLAAAQMGIYLFMIVLIMSRAVGEAGLLMTETSFLPANVIGLFYPLPNLGPANMTMLGLTNIVFARDLRGMLLSSFLDNQKMAKETGLRHRSLLLPLITAVVVSFVAASAFFLLFNYEKGGLSLYSYANQSSPRDAFSWVANGGGTAANPDATSYGGVIVGIITTSLLVWLRGIYAWFPLHPLAYAIAPTWTLTVFWFPFLVAWAIKSAVLRFGGIDTYRRISPFMLGLILGEFGSAVMWAVMNMTRSWSTPSFPWP
jgi:hypothetical protein